MTEQFMLKMLARHRVLDTIENRRNVLHGIYKLEYLQSHGIYCWIQSNKIKRCVVRTQNWFRRCLDAMLTRCEGIKYGVIP